MGKKPKKAKKATKRLQPDVQLAPISVDFIKRKETQDAATILEYTHRTAGSLLAACELMREDRGARRGRLTDAEQDVLRAMLVMAAAGLDGMAKQLIRDSLPDLVHKDPEVQDGLEKFAARQIRGDANTPETTTGTKFLARILAAESQQRQMIEEYIRELTSGSLQSADELMRVAGAFGVQPPDVGIDPKQLQTIFETRNQIIHELDIDLEGDRSKRNLRKQDDMVGNTDVLLKIGLELIKAVHDKLAYVSGKSRKVSSKAR